MKRVELHRSYALYQQRMIHLRQNTEVKQCLKKVTTLYTTVPAQKSEIATNRTAEGRHNCKICSCLALTLVVTSLDLKLAQNYLL